MFTVRGTFSFCWYWWNY